MANRQLRLTAVPGWPMELRGLASPPSVFSGGLGTDSCTEVPAAMWLSGRDFDSCPLALLGRTQSVGTHLPVRRPALLVCKAVAG